MAARSDEGKGAENDAAAKAKGESLETLVAPQGGDELAVSVSELAAEGVGHEDLTFDSEDVEDQMVLSLSDLLPDAGGDVVLFSDAGPLAVNITTHSRILDTGTADHYVTSTGVDVSGFHFLTFEEGPTIYYPSDIDLLITSDVS